MATFASGLQPPLAVAILAAALLAGCGGGSAPAATQASTARTSPQPSPSPPTAGVTPPTAGVTPPTAGVTPPTAGVAPPSAGVSPASASPRPSSPPTALPVAPGAGTLPQTRAFPSTNSAAFRAAMQDLWLAVTAGNPRLALPAFFPLAAYRQVKAIADPATDWDDRLWYDFTLDVGAAHRLVDPDARLVRVIVPVSDAAWVDPGACYNSIGYWHVPGARVVYQQGGQERSFGIASLISWRGVWYVVHFGAVLRSAPAGIVDQPALGPGVPGPPGGC